ncbi:SDR family oxidoreductase [Novosphingobium sp. BL-52-GroH]|uniref:SDR family oxidoreductase n=1 Tax=Novosphingobium sp. BL-52-GroH TaxID=3349877 RepID=UPI00384A7A80
MATRIRLKPLAEQVIIVTGASSGIGLATVRKAAAAGAAVVLASRDGETLARITHDIEAAGGRALVVSTDVGDEAAVKALACAAVARFGRIDTWVNNAGIAVHGNPSALSTADHERALRTDYWGTVFGSLAALAHFRARGGPGAIINIGSIASDFSSPLLTVHSATKHAVRAYTDSLRLEVLARREPISLTLVKPSMIGTPGIHEHGRDLGDWQLAMPIAYAPEIVAGTILRAAARPLREVTVGSAGILVTGFARTFPALYERLAASGSGAMKQPRQRLRGDSLHSPTANGRVRSDIPVRQTSIFTAFQTRPGVRMAVSALVAGTTVAIILRRRTENSAR